jgi:hypothetical protein
VNIDERIVEMLSNSYSLPSQAMEQLSLLEREMFEKFADNERRVWGELDPLTLQKYKQQ